MSALLATVHGPSIAWGPFSPLLAYAAGGIVVLLLGLGRSRITREHVVPALTIVTLLASLGLTVWQWDVGRSIISGALRVDGLALSLNGVFVVAGLGATVLGWRSLAPREAAHGEWFGLLLASAGGMLTLVMAQNIVVLFLGIEILSIPLYVLCATELRRRTSLEAGLKYLVVGSVGSATLLYGLALIYGATGKTDYSAIAQALGNGKLTDPLFLTGVALVVTGLGFKASVAPFHQWTPDVYEGAPTPITAFMATATKAAAFGVLVRFFNVAVVDAQVNWGPALAALATITIVVGNVGAIGQSSVKRILAWSGVAQAGYMLAGVVVSTQLGVQASVFYLMVYLLMNVGAFAVVQARERETALSDDISALAGLGASRPLLAWPMTIAMLALAGIPATSGFIGKFQLIRAAVDGNYTWLGVLIVVGSMLSLVYYLRIVATMWMSAAPAAAPAGVPVMAGGSQELDTLAGDGSPELAADPAVGGPGRAGWEVYGVALLCGLTTILFGLWPSPLFDLAGSAGHALGGLF